MRKLIAPITVAAALLAVAPAAPAAQAPPRDIVRTAAGSGQFDTLVSLVREAGLARTLRREGPFTVFAPTDAAFAKVPQSTLQDLRNDRAQLRRVLLYHVLAGRYRASRLIRAGSVATLAGPPVDIQARGDRVRVAGARVVAPNVRASNGVIHAVNRVLIPPAE